MELRAASKEDTEQVRRWRNETRETKRTPYLLTEEMQADFYENIVCNRDHNSRWWSVYDKEFIGQVGLTDIEWENGLAQITMTLSPRYQRQGYGRKAFELVLDEAFGNMGLDTVCGECYQCNPAVEFWKKVTKEHGGYYTMIPRRKRWQGQLYDALHFSVWR